MGALLDISSEVMLGVTAVFASSQNDYIFANIALVTDTLSGTIHSNNANPTVSKGIYVGTMFYPTIYGSGEI